MKIHLDMKPLSFFYFWLEQNNFNICQLVLDFPHNCFFFLSSLQSIQCLLWSVCNNLNNFELHLESMHLNGH